MAGCDDGTHCTIAPPVVPKILAQRLMINMRKVEYIGCAPVASKLLFARSLSGTEEELDDFSQESPQLDEKSARLRQEHPVSESRDDNHQVC
ncbi:hypothetical protein NMY22_g8930 [Coprinellus aureogranulatus]|nr:hypothetical protein NMY22_g8930 [Coprinellus aureogranulatus]